MSRKREIKDGKAISHGCDNGRRLLLTVLLRLNCQSTGCFPMLEVSTSAVAEALHTNFSSGCGRARNNKHWEARANCKLWASLSLTVDMAV